MMSLVAFVIAIMRRNLKETKLAFCWLAIHSKFAHLKSRQKISVSKRQKTVEINSFNSKHNYNLNRQMLIKAKMAAHQYIINTKHVTECSNQLKMDQFTLSILGIFLSNSTQIASQLHCKQCLTSSWSARTSSKNMVL